MAWSDAARRAAQLARRLKRVLRYDAPGPRKQDQKDYLVAELSQKVTRLRNRVRMEQSQFREARSRRETEQKRLRRINTRDWWRN